MIVEIGEELYDCDASDGEIDEDPPDEIQTLSAQVSGIETRRQVKKLIERWRSRGTPIAKAYAYELEQLLG